MKITIATLAGVTVFAAAAIAGPAKEVPITTSSEEARALYVKGRDLAEKLRATDAHAAFAKAVQKDPSFALAYLGLAGSSGTTKEFFDALEHAVALAGKVSAGEQALIHATEAGAKAELTKQKAELDKLVATFPADARVQNQLGQYYFNNADYKAAISAYEKAIEIDPKLTQPYNQLGYAYRFTDKPADAERTFKKYIELIPDDPNPYDSYGELLMEEGKFDESIKSYEKALKIDATFTPSYIGIANDQMFAGKGNDARKTLTKLANVARNDGEKRQALFWTGMSYIHEGAWDKALAELDKEAAVAQAAKDLGNLANDYNFSATILLEAGRADDALKKFQLQVETIDKAKVPQEVKDRAHRNFLFDAAWVAVVNKDLATAKTKQAEYKKATSGKGPGELRQLHELNGMIAIAERQWKLALAELAEAQPRDPRIFYLTAIASQGAGDMAAAKKWAQRAASFNGLAPNYPFVRAKAQALAKH